MVSKQAVIGVIILVFSMPFLLNTMITDGMKLDWTKPSDFTIEKLKNFVILIGIELIPVMFGLWLITREVESNRHHS